MELWVLDVWGSYYEPHLKSYCGNLTDNGKEILPRPSWILRYVVDFQTLHYSAQCVLCTVWVPSNRTSWDISCVLIYHLSYMSQVVRLEGKHGFWGNRDFETLKGLAPFTYTVKLIKSWVHWPSYLTYFWPFGVILGPCGLFWIISDKIWFFNPNHFAKKHFVFVRQKLKFCLKWSIFQD